MSTNIPADVGRIRGLADDVLEGSPTLAGGRGSALVGKLGINTSSQLVDGVLDEAALRNAGTEEDGVDGEQDPGPFLEEKRGANNAEPEGNLEHGDEGHGAIIVLLDELANGLGGSGARGLGTSWTGSLRRLDGGQQVGAHVSRNVEYGVNCKREDCKRDLAREEPNKRHDCNVVSTCYKIMESCKTYPDIARSHPRPEQQRHPAFRPSCVRGMPCRLRFRR